MCLAVPGRILEMTREDDLTMGVVDVSGARIRACLSLTPEARVGDHVIVHAGVALQVLDEDEARETLAEIARLIEASEQPPDLRP